jgi:geranylgeranyl diphosphate synthase type I
VGDRGEPTDGATGQPRLEGPPQLPPDPEPDAAPGEERQPERPPEPQGARLLRDRVERILDDFFTTQLAQLGAIDESLHQAVGAARALVAAGGKRLRPAFCYWGWRGAGKPDGEGIVTAAAALELLHASALVHDDLMDASATRRGRPSVHRAFARQHRNGGWHGDPDAFGAAAAILIGDLCLIWADVLLSGAGLEPAQLASGRPLYDRMRVELMAGQYLDVLDQAVGEESVDRAMHVVEFKSARYTVSGPLQFGGALAGARQPLDALYLRYGIPLGNAFQLRDDLLGVFGDPKETGKPAGDDLRQGKRTVLIALALERSAGREVELLRSRLGDPELSDEEVDDLRRLISASGAPAAVEQMILARTGEALAALERDTLPAEAFAALVDLAGAATSRRT